MSPFEYLLTFLAIILGLGITDMLESLHKLLTGPRIRWHWMPVLWAMAVFYVVAGVPATAGTFPEYDAAGWTLIVAFRHPLFPAKNMTIFLGDQLTEALVRGRSVNSLRTPEKVAASLLAWPEIRRLEGLPLRSSSAVN